MPIYTFKCGTCDEVFDARRSMAEAGEPIIHSCGGLANRFYSTTPTVAFRPDGWYLSPEDPKYFSTLTDRKEPYKWQTR